MVVRFYVKTLSGRIFTIQCDTEEQLKKMTVRELKERITPLQGHSVDQQRLIFAGRQLEDHRLLSDYYGVKPESTIHLVLKLRVGESESIQPAAEPRGAPQRRSADMDIIYQVVVHRLMGQKVMVNLCDTEEQMQRMTVRQLKEKIAQELRWVAESNVRVVFIDRELDDDGCLLSAYGIQHMSNIHLVVKVPGGGPPPPRPEDEEATGGGIGGRRNSMERLSDFCSSPFPFPSRLRKSEDS